MRSGSSLWLSMWGVSFACSLLSCISCAGLHRGIQWCSAFCRLVARRWRSVLGGIVIVAVDRSGAAALAAAGSARADPACVARLARVVFSRGATAGLESHGFFCCAVAFFRSFGRSLIRYSLLCPWRVGVPLCVVVCICVPFLRFSFCKRLYGVQQHFNFSSVALYPITIIFIGIGRERIY